MPARDKRGPLGDGPMTGRGLGQCGSNNRVGSDYGRGFAGRGAGRGRNFNFNVDTQTSNEVQSLKDRIYELEKLVDNK